jgi:hypothetical protein
MNFVVLFWFISFVNKKNSFTCVNLLLYAYVCSYMCIQDLSSSSTEPSGSATFPWSHWSIPDPQVFPISSRSLPWDCAQIPFRNPDTTFYVLALRARQPSHMTGAPRDPRPIFHRGFRVFIVEPHKSLGLAILRSPICS